MKRVGKPRFNSHGSHGFTLVELLIVIVVIAILAAITIIAYNGVTQKARAASLQSDLKNGATALGISKANNDQYPADLSTANDGHPLNASSGNTFNYSATGDGSAYCLQDEGFGVSYFVTNDNQVPQTGSCSGAMGVPGSGSIVTAPPNGGVVSTLAGSGTDGTADGTGAAAQFGFPCDIAVDSSGNTYVPDCWNNNIRKITPLGVVTTLAGSTAGTSGYTDGTGTSAKFNWPNGVAVDKSGNVYVADTNNNRIRKITPDGVVTTFAGSGVAGAADGTGTAAQFSNPQDVAVDSSGTIYVADAGNNSIRKITSAGVVTTLAGSGTYGSVDGTGTAAQFMQPSRITVSSSGIIYVAAGGRIREISQSGVVMTLAGSDTWGFADGTGAAAQFGGGGTGVAVDVAGNVYVADQNNYRIRKISPAAVVTTFAGSGVEGFADGTHTAAEFDDPDGVDVDAAGIVYIADGYNHRIRLIK